MKEKLFHVLIAIVLVMSIFIVRPFSAYAYTESYVQTGTHDNRSYSCSGSCTESKGKAKTSYTQSVSLRLNITGYYIYLENGVRTPDVGYHNESTTASSFEITVTPSTFGQFNTAYVGMCKVNNKHYISNTLVENRTAQFQYYPG